VLVKELKSLSLDVKIMNSQGKEIDIRGDIDAKDETNDNLLKVLSE